MKKLRFLSVVLLASLSVFTSCEKDVEDHNVTVDFEDAALLTHTGGNSTYYDNILWGKELASLDSYDNNTYEGYVYVSATTPKVSFGSYYSDFASYGTSFDTWAGFVISSNNNTTDTALANQFSVYASSASKFAVGYYSGYFGSDYDVPTLVFDREVDLISVDVANTTYAYNYCKTKADADNAFYYNIVAEGYQAGGTLVGKVSIPMAANGVVLSDWALIDLSTLDDVYKVVFTVDTNDTGSWGINVPSYFCIDNLVFDNE